MTCVEYQLLRKKRPDLRLPSWYELQRQDRNAARRMSGRRLVSVRVAKLMVRDVGIVDRTR